MHAEGRGAGARNRNEGTRQTEDFPEVPGDAQEVLQQEAQQGSEVVYHEEEQADEARREESSEPQARVAKLPEHPRGRRKCFISEKL